MLRRDLDYSDLSHWMAEVDSHWMAEVDSHWMAEVDAAMRQTRRVLAQLSAASAGPHDAIDAVAERMDSEGEGE